MRVVAHKTKRLIVIEIGGVVRTLSPEKAKELWEQLRHAAEELSRRDRPHLPAVVSEAYLMERKTSMPTHKEAVAMLERLSARVVELERLSARVVDEMMAARPAPVVRKAKK